MRGSQAGAEAKDIRDAGLHLAIRVLPNGAIVAADIADWQRAAQGAPARFIPAPLMETAAQREELCLRQSALHPKEKFVIRFAGIVNGALMGPRRARAATALHKPVQAPARAST